MKEFCYEPAPDRPRPWGAFLLAALAGLASPLTAAAQTLSVPVESVALSLTAPSALVVPDVRDRTLEAGRETTVTLPEAAGGGGTYAYSVVRQGSTTVPDWLSFDPDTRVLTAAPSHSLVGDSFTFVYSATDGTDTAQDSFTVTVRDTTRPRVSAEYPAHHNGSHVFSVRVTFSERVTGFDYPAEDLEITGGTAPGRVVKWEVDGNPNTWAFNVRPSGAQDVTIRVKENAARDARGNGNVSKSFTVRHDGTPAVADTTAPRITKIERWPRAARARTSADSLLFRVHFNEDIRDASASDFGATGGLNVGRRSLPDGARVVAIWLDDPGSGVLANYNGEVGLTVLPGTDITDLAGNALDRTLPTGNDYETWTLDNTRPVPTVTAPDTHDGSAFGIEVTFSEDVFGLKANHLSVTGGTLSGFSAESSRYNATVTPSGTEDVAISVAAYGAHDDAANGNTAGSLTIPYAATPSPDTTAPRITRIWRGPGGVSPTNADTLVFDVTFSEPVSNATAADFQMTIRPRRQGGGVAVTRSSTVIGPSSIRITIEDPGNGVLRDHNGEVGLEVLATTDITDTAGNALDRTLPGAGSYHAYLVDNRAPTATVTGPSTHDGGTAFDITLAFSETVTGFAADDVTVTNGALSNFAGQNNRYTATVTPTGASDVAVSVAASRAEDAAGNGNAAGALTVGYADPAVLALPDVRDRTLEAGRESTVTLPEATGGGAAVTYSVVRQGGTTVPDWVEFDPTTRVLTTAPSHSLVGDSFTFVYSATDGADTAQKSFTVTVVQDTTPPRFSTQWPSTHDGRTVFSVIVTFTETVTGFDNAAEDLTVTGATLASRIVPSPRDGTNAYAFQVRPNGAQDIRIRINANAAQDLAGNGNVQTRTYGVDHDGTPLPDTTAPTVGIVAPGTHDGSAFEIAIGFNEPVTGFTLGEISVTGGTASNFRAGQNGTDYAATVTPAGTDAVSISVAADVADDGAGNGNEASSIETVSFDGPPTVAACAAIAPPAPSDLTRAYDESWNVTLPPSATADGHNLRVLLDGREAKLSEVGMRYVPGATRPATRRKRCAGNMPARRSRSFTGRGGPATASCRPPTRGSRSPLPLPRPTACRRTSACSRRGTRATRSGRSCISVRSQTSATRTCATRCLR